MLLTLSQLFVNRTTAKLFRPLHFPHSGRHLLSLIVISSSTTSIVSPSGRDRASSSSSSSSSPRAAPPLKNVVLVKKKTVTIPNEEARTPPPPLETGCLLLLHRVSVTQWSAARRTVPLLTSRPFPVAFYPCVPPSFALRSMAKRRSSCCRCASDSAASSSRCFYASS